MTKNKPITEFIALLTGSLGDSTFVKLTLGQYRGKDSTLKSIHVRKVVVKREEVLSFTYRHKTKDIVKNHDIKTATGMIGSMLDHDFSGATLFTTAADYALDLKNGHVHKNKPTHNAVPDMAHDRAKIRQVDASAPWLHALGITDANGNIKKTAQDKFRQIDKYIETLSAQLKSIKVADGLRVADMGAGKGYLTFALYDYLATTLNIKPVVTGVEYRCDLVDFCNKTAKACGFDGLNFVQGTIADCDSAGVNVLIALHACDTATDDAIAKGIKAGADLIVVAPCCHKQIRKEMEKSKKENVITPLLDHGIFMERQAEMVTDGLRALILESQGYTTKVFEFISDEHTPKNVMIVAARNPKAKPNDPAILKKIAEMKAFFGIRQHYLEHIT